MPQMTIGRLARAAGVHVETIRYYQRLGLLDNPPRPPGGVRRYTGREVAKLRFIKRAQELGFSLTETRRLMRLEDPQACRTARSLATEKLAHVESKLTDLARLQAVLSELIGRCDGQRGRQACPIIESLASGR
jgi:MerR family mercuric resistance operon transcriptional regulator